MTDLASDPRSRVMWTRDLRPASTAPRDGTRFIGFRKGSTASAIVVYDEWMGCFAEVEDVYSPFDRLAAWAPLTKPGTMETML